MDTLYKKTSNGVADYSESNGRNKSSLRCADFAVTAIAAAAVFVMTVSAPVTIDPGAPGFDLVGPAKAHAAMGGGGKGGGKGGGNAGGNNGGGNNGGGNNGGGNAGGGNNGGGNGGGGNGGGNGGTGESGGGRDVAFATTAPSISVAVFTTEIKKRYPANDVAVLDDPNQAVSFFSELHAMAGRNITHRWSYGGTVRFQATFQVLAQRWRIWSTQLLPAELAGEWTVDIVDERGKVLQSHSIMFRPIAGV